MNRMLGFYPLFWAVIAIIAIFIVCFFNMYLLAKHKKSLYTVFFNVVSLFTVLGLTFSMLSVAVFVHPMSKLYQNLWQGSLFLTLGSMLIGIIAVLTVRKKQGLRNLTHNIPDTLESIEAVVFVVGRDGTVAHINHLEKYRILFGNIGTLDQLIAFIHMNCNVCEKDLESMDNILGQQTYEIYNEQVKAYFLFQLNPILIGDNLMGYTAVLEDITAIRNSERKLREQNESLRQANAKLSQYIQAAGALEAEKERLQILSQVQETLIRDIEKALYIIRSVKQRGFEDSTYQEAMKVLAAQLRNIYQKVRCAVGQIAGKEGNT